MAQLSNNSSHVLTCSKSGKASRDHPSLSASVNWIKMMTDQRLDPEFNEIGQSPYVSQMAIHKEPDEMPASSPSIRATEISKLKGKTRSDMQLDQAVAVPHVASCGWASLTDSEFQTLSLCHAILNSDINFRDKSSVANQNVSTPDRCKDEVDHKEHRAKIGNNRKVRFYGSYETTYDVRTSPSQIANRIPHQDYLWEQNPRFPQSPMILGILKHSDESQSWSGNHLISELRHCVFTPRKEDPAQEIATSSVLALLMKHSKK